MLAKMKAVTVKTQNVLVNNFLKMRQHTSESVWLYLGCLKGTVRHCNFNLPMGQTSYKDKKILQTLVQGLKDAVLAKDVMDKYTTNDNLQNHLTQKKHQHYRRG